MTIPMGKPERKHVVGIKIQADTWEDVVERMFDLARYFEEHGPGRQLVSGGGSSGCIAVDVTNEGQTHDNYFSELDQWIEEHREKETTAVRAGG